MGRLKFGLPIFQVGVNPMHTEFSVDWLRCSRKHLPLSGVMLSARNFTVCFIQSGWNDIGSVVRRE
jgi:hypothetical protein